MSLNSKKSERLRIATLRAYSLYRYEAYEDAHFSCLGPVGEQVEQVGLLGQFRLRALKGEAPYALSRSLCNKTTP
jgi:hypothetical protein